MIQGTAISLSCELKKHFLKKIMFFQPYHHSPNVVIASDSIEEVLATIAHPQSCIKSAAATFQADILLYCNAIKDQHWPPTIETVTAKYVLLPYLVKLFLNTLLYSGRKNIDKLDILPCLVEPFCADFGHATSKGEVITPKH